MNFIEEMKKLKKDYECQCIENGRKQDQILELKRKLREREEEVEKLKAEIKVLKEVAHDRGTNPKRK